MAHGQRQGINEGNPPRLPKAQMQIGRQGHDGPGLEFDEAGVTDQMGESRLEVLTYMIQVEVLEGPIIGLMKQDDDRHDFTHRQRGGPDLAPFRWTSR